MGIDCPDVRQIIQFTGVFQMMRRCMFKRQDELEGMGLCHVHFSCLARVTLTRSVHQNLCKGTVLMLNKSVERIFFFLTSMVTIVVRVVDVVVVTYA